MKGWMLRHSSKVSYWLLTQYFLSILMFPLASVSRALATTYDDMESIRAMQTSHQKVSTPEMIASKHISVAMPQISTSGADVSSSLPSSWQLIDSNKKVKRSTVSLPSLDTKKTSEEDKNEGVNQKISESPPP